MQSDLGDTTDESSSDTDSSSDEKKPQPSQTEYVAPLNDSTLIKPITPGRKNRNNMFNPSQLNAGLYSKKSIAYEMTEMVHALRGHIEDYQGSPSDIEFMSDSADAIGGDDGDEKSAIINGLPNLDHFTNVLAELSTSQSLSEPKYESNKLMKKKLDTLHDKIGVFIKQIATHMTRTRNQKLVNTYQNAYDFLDDIQHEIETFDENIVENEAKLQQMETSIRHSEQKYKSLMVKFKQARSDEKKLRANELDLKKQVWDLSMAQSSLMLSEANSIISSEQSDDEERDLSDQDVPDHHEPEPTTVIHPQQPQKDTSSPSYGQQLVPDRVVKRKKRKRAPPKKKPKLIFNPPKRPSMPGFKAPPPQPLNVRAKPKPKYKLKRDIKPSDNAYLYDEFKHDESNACASEFWTVFGREIGFLACNRHG